jgi:probable HAF family extracellular repeat protein
MTKQKFLVALLVGSSIGCFCDTHLTSAQNIPSLSYRLQVLVNPEGGFSNPFSINNRDWVSGDINQPSDLFDQPGLWRRTTDSANGKQSWQFTNLGTLAGPNPELNAGVLSPIKNENGWLAGRSDTAATDTYKENFCGWVCSGHGCPGTSTNNVCQGFLWRAETNKMIALPPLTKGCNAQVTSIGCNSWAAAANNNRKIAGLAETGVMAQTCAPPQVFLYEGVVWGLDASGAPFIQRRLPPIRGDAVSQAFGMNDAGTAVGGSGGCAPPGAPPPPPQPLRAVLWKDGSNPVDLGTLGGSQAIAGGINERGQVVGQSFLPGDAVVHAFLWQEGVGMKDLGSLLPDDSSFPQSINNGGEVVGWSCGPNELATPFSCGPFYWRNGMKQPVDLNQLIQSPHLQLCCVSDINDSGEIIGAAFDPTFNQTGDFVTAILVPQPGGPPIAESLPVQSAAAAQPSVLPSATLQRLIPRLHGWKIGR